MNERLSGWYATQLYLPFSSASRKWRRFSRRVRGKQDKFLQDTTLPEVSWKTCTPERTIRIWENEKANGNVRISELAILAALAAGCETGKNIFEIGTFDGRTTLNLALNSPQNCNVYSLDLPPHVETKFAIDKGERHMVDKPAPGRRYRKYKDVYPENIGKITQLLGDSATFDFSPFEKSCSLVFVDGSHAYDYAVADTVSAMRLVAPGGVIVWHDYGVWEGVTRALEELECRENLGLRNIAGTTLAFWKNQGRN